MIEHRLIERGMHLACVKVLKMIGGELVRHIFPLLLLIVEILLCYDLFLQKFVSLRLFPLHFLPLSSLQLLMLACSPRSEGLIP